MPVLEIPALKRSELGGKAASLVSLSGAGFDVPDFLVSPDDLAQALAHLGAPLAVRSSATVEDGRRASFAGQFTSVLNVNTLDELEEAVRRCRQSAHAPSVAAYCRRNGINPALVRMQVIVQRMVQPQLSGVAFTVDPTTGAQRVVIEACRGLGDQLVSGRQAALPADHALLRRHRRAIEQMAQRVQRHFGSPQDIEFAIDESDRVWVLQSRPITRIAFRPGDGEWTNADFRDGGVSSGVCTPLMWSLYDFVWGQTLKGFLGEVGLLDGDFEAARMFFGRPYWNLGAVKHCLAKLPGFVERQFDEDLSVQPTYDGDGVRTAVTLRRLLAALPTVWKINRFFGRQQRFDQWFLNEGFAPIERRYETMPADVGASFRQLVERDLLLTESNYFRTIFAASLAKLDFKQAFADADYAELVAGLPPMRHMDPVAALREMRARGEGDVSALLRRFRHHSARGLDICQPRWDEDRAFVESLLAEVRPAPGDDSQLAAGEASQRRGEAARRRAMSRLPRWRRRAFADKLDRLRRFVWLREQMRDLSSRVYYHIRRHALRIGQRRGLGDDVFFMTFAEVFDDDRGQIQPRRHTYESYRHFKAPNEIGSRFTFAAEPARGAMVGIAASRGVARGVARVAHSAQEAARVASGAILVCPFTDPGWTPVLDRVAAVVTETGGMLSHAAVICREYGIPAVLGVCGATERIADGASIVVDANRGCVELCQSSSATSPAAPGAGGGDQ